MTEQPVRAAPDPVSRHPHEPVGLLGVNEAEITETPDRIWAADGIRFDATLFDTVEAHGLGHWTYEFLRSSR